MRFLVVLFTATSAIEATVGIPEPLWMLVWGAGLFAISAVLSRGRREVGAPAGSSSPTPIAAMPQQAALAGDARG